MKEGREEGRKGKAKKKEKRERGTNGHLLP